MHPPEPYRELVSISKDAHRLREIRDSDLLQFRRRGLISIAGRGEHSHSAKAAWWGDDLFCLEVREWHGGRAVTLASQVRKFPGLIDVYSTNPENRWPDYNRVAATQYMRQLCGCPYGYGHVLHASAAHLFGVRMFSRVDTDDLSLPSGPPFCSEACAMADRIGGGVDPVEELADHGTEPSDLSRSPFYQYLYTLVP